MSKDTKEKDDETTLSNKNWSYDGNEDEWNTFDRRLQRYMRKKLGVLGENLWLGTVPDFATLSSLEYDVYCNGVWMAIDCNDSVQARKLWDPTSGFWTYAYQRMWVERQLSLMIDYVEEHAKGQVEAEIINFNGNKYEIRKHLYKQFGAGSGGDIHQKELHFDKGMPEPGQHAFPKNCDMTAKLRQLEGRRLYFMKMCDVSRRATYTYALETKLVRIVIDHIGPDYKNCIQRVLDMVKVQKMIQSSQGVGILDVNNVPDSHERSFSDDWLPSWKLLQASLISEYRLKLKTKEEHEQKKTPKEKLPVATIALGSVKCYACGGPHKKGDPACKAGPFDVHECAPADYKEKQEVKKRKYGGKG